MRKQGYIVRWDATRGFGFIRSPDTSADVFFHVRDFQSRALPHEGLAVVYEEIHVGGKGPRAMAVQPTDPAQSAPCPDKPAGQRTQPATSSRKPTQPTSQVPAGAGLAYFLMLAWSALIAWGLWAQHLPLWTLAALAAVNVATLWSYAADKNAARSGAWRTPEKKLHLLAVLGGWPAAWLAQQNMRHKSRKTAFRTVYWFTVVLNCAVLALWLLRDRLPAL